MVYRAEFRNFKAVTAIALLLVALSAIAAALGRAMGPVLVAAAIAGSLLWIRLRVRLVIEDDYFEYTGPLLRRRVNWAAITRERSVLSAGWPADRLFGAFVHEFWTADGVTRVSFLFFPAASRPAVLARARAGRQGGGEAVTPSP